MREFRKATSVFTNICLSFLWLPAFAYSASESSNAFNQGSKLLDEHRYSEAVPYLTKAIKLDPTDAKAYCERGLAYSEYAYMDFGSYNHPVDFTNALNDFDKAISLDPKDALAYSGRAIVKACALAECKSQDNGLTDANKAISLNSKLAQCYEARSLVHQYSRQPDNARADADEAIRLNPKLAEAFGRRAAFYTSIQKTGEALDDCDRAIALAPNDPTFYLERGCLMSWFRPELALADYNKAISLDPKNPMFYLERAEAHVKIDFHKSFSEHKSGVILPSPAAREKQMDDLNKAISLHPKTSLPYVIRGRAFSEMKQYDNAARDISSAIELDPKNTELYETRSAAYISMGEPKRAIQGYDQLIQHCPREGKSYRLRGEIYEKVGQRDKAMEDINKAISLSSRNAYFSRARLYTADSDYQKALADCTIGLSKFPDGYCGGDIVAAYDQRAQIYEKAGRHDLAQLDLAKAKELSHRSDIPPVSVAQFDDALKQQNADMDKLCKRLPANFTSTGRFGGESFYSFWSGKFSFQQKLGENIAPVGQTYAVMPFAVCRVGSGSRMGNLEKLDWSITEADTLPRQFLKLISPQKNEDGHFYNFDPILTKGYLTAKNEGVRPWTHVSANQIVYSAAVFQIPVSLTMTDLIADFSVRCFDGSGTGVVH